MNKLKEKLTVGILALALVGGMAAHLALPDQAISKSERRKLDQLPQFTTEALLSGKYATDLEDYLLDQFPLRDGFRTLKSVWTYYVLGQKDNNGIYIKNGTVSKLDPTLNEKQVQYFVDKMNSLHDQYFPTSDVTVAIVPDKNYYLALGRDYPRLDYETMYNMLETGMPWADHVDLRSDLDWDLYYTTDTHWRQENLQWVIDDLALHMDLELPQLSTYRQTTIPNFYGVYYGQAALPMPAEDLIYLENDVTDAAIVTGPELKGEQPVYKPGADQGMDFYDVFLHGPQSILTIENPLAETDRELIIFRDSFGSSITPLLLSGYKTVTMIDVRYVNSMMLPQLVDFHGQEVLILYSSTLVNSAAILK